MSAIINIGKIYPTLPLQPSSPSLAPRPVESATAPGDSVEISRFGEALSRVDGLSSLSLARIQAIRMEIENGTFETPARIEGTVRRASRAPSPGWPTFCVRHATR